MLRDVFLPGACLFDVQAASKDELFDLMCQALLENGRIRDKAEFMAALHKREKDGPTGMGDGVAIPHGKSDCVVAPSLLFARTAQGVPYESMDDQPVRYVFMIAANNASGESANEHLKILSSLARKLVHPEFVEKIKNSNSGEDIAALL